MKRYMIKSRTADSQVDRNINFALGEEELKQTLIEILNTGAMIDWIGEKDSLDTIGRFHETSNYKILKEFGLLEQNFKNEDIIWNIWEGR